MDFHGLGNLGHGQRLEVRDALVEKLGLPRHDLAGDAEDGLLALVNAFDQKGAGADAVAHVLLHLGTGIGGFHEATVVAADLDMRQLAVVHDDHVFAFDLLDDNLGNDVGGHLVCVDPPRLGIERGDKRGGLLQLLAGDLELFGQVGQAPCPHLGEVLVDQRPGQRIGLAEAVELQHQALAQITGTHAGGVKILDQGEDALQAWQLGSGGRGQLFHAARQVAVVIDAAYDHFAQAHVIVIQLGKLKLLDQMFLQRLLLGQ